MTEEEVLSMGRGPLDGDPNRNTVCVQETKKGFVVVKKYG